MPEIKKEITINDINPDGSLVSETNPKKEENKKTENKWMDTNLPGPGPGRPPGSKNKFTNIKNDLLEAYQELGGIEYLKTLGKEDRKSFTKLIAKLLPQELIVEMQDLEDLQIIHTHENNTDTKTNTNT